MFVIGRILKPHGVKGDVRVFPTTDNPSRFEWLEKVHIEFETPREPLLLDIERVRFSRQLVLLKLKGIDSMDSADKLRGGRITISDEDALPLGIDEYYARDLYNMTVITDIGEELGILTDILETGANDVYAVRMANGRDILIPAVKQYILSVDIKAQVMIVRLIEGLR